MISTTIFNEDHRASFRAFVGAMINDWPDRSSMQQDVSCCPDRTIADVLDRYERAIAGDGVLIVAKDDAGGPIVGTLVIERGPRWLRYAEGHLLNIHPSHRGRGCARRLIGHGVTALRNGRVKKLILRTWDGNGPALAAFEKAGALMVDRDPGHTITTETCLPMVLSTLDDRDVDRDVQAGNFSARATLDGGLVHLRLSVAGRQRDFAAIPS